MRNHYSHIFPLVFAGISAWFFLGSCKKIIEKEKQKVAENIVTDGTWRVSKYDSAGTDLTARFDGYNFQFLDNGQVQGVLSTAAVTGTWTVNINAKTILAEFPPAAQPVNLLNHLWTIKDSYSDSVSAISATDSLPNHLELHKN